MNWYAGNLHCHSTNSDGDVSPKEVTNWYVQNGYSFLSITDHNTLTEVEEYFIEKEGFIGISGSEYTRGVGSIQTHINGIGIDRAIPLPNKSESVIESLQFGIDGINELGGLAMINHPNWLWSFGAEELQQVNGALCFEVFNGGYTCNSDGNNKHDSTDEIWDKLLSANIKIFGVASDDAHTYNKTAISPNGISDTAGSGWIWVQANELSEKSILNAIKSGDFIASTGIKCSTLLRSEKEITLEIEPIGDIEFTTHFIGKGGKLLDKQYGYKPSYKICGDEGYVRARIESTDRVKAWIQPVFI
jgi:hypothetical protein